MTDDHRMHRLPRWAQQRIQVLEADLVVLYTRIQQMVPSEEGGESSRIKLRLHGVADLDPIGLPTIAQVDFYLGKKMRGEDSITVRLDRDKSGYFLELRSDFEGLSIEPEVTNVVRARIRRR